MTHTHIFHAPFKGLQIILIYPHYGSDRTPISYFSTSIDIGQLPVGESALSFVESSDPREFSFSIHQ